MLANDATFCTFRDQDHVVTFHESNEAEQSIGADFLLKKINYMR